MFAATFNDFQNAQAIDATQRAETHEQEYARLVREAKESCRTCRAKKADKCVSPVPAAGSKRRIPLTAIVPTPRNCYMRDALAASIRRAPLP